MAAGLPLQIVIFKFASGLTMQAQLTNIPTYTLLDMPYIVLAREAAITATDAAEIEELQREVQRRGGAPNWSFGSTN
jgi:hypothetical protein